MTENGKPKPHRSKAQLAAMAARREQQALKATASYGPRSDRTIRCLNPKCKREFAEKGPSNILGSAVAPITCFYCGWVLPKRPGV